METRITVTGLDNVIGVVGDVPKHTRFGASVGMNRTMSEAQDAIREQLPAHFTLRRTSFVKNTIYRQTGLDWATKDKLIAGVRIDERRNFLAKFEAGGNKLPTDGRQFLAIPVDVRRNKNDIVTKANSVKALMATGKAYIRDGKVWLLTGRGKIKTRILAYVLKRATPIAPSLGFVDTATKVINARASDNIAGAIEIELTRGLVTRSGVQG